MPFYLTSALDTVEALFIVECPLTRATAALLEENAGVPLHRIPNDPAHASDIWMQDTTEIGTDEKGQPVALLGLRGKHDRGLTCGPLDERVAAYFAEKFPQMKTIRVGEPKAGRRWIDWFGNLEVSPPVTKFPHGRILTGRQKDLTLHPEALAFLENQGVQGPPLFLNVSWLTIGHVDELITFIPWGRRGWKVVLPSPALAREVLKKRPPSEAVFAGRKGESTVEKLLTLAEGAEQKAIEVALAETKQQLKAELGIDAKRIVEVPALFERGLAVIPNPVNLLVVNKKLFVPDAAYAPFNEAISRNLKSTGVSVMFVDIWDNYHVRAGELHCGTNALRRRSKA
jgi:protein-arginine deiminase